MRACLTLLSSCLLNYFSNSDPATEKDEMSSPPADDAPVRSERPKLNLKPRDEGAAAKLATERAVAAKSVSEVFAGDGHSRVSEPPEKMQSIDTRFLAFASSFRTLTCARCCQCERNAQLKVTE
jgi:hypothetical protein